ncbi:hypothetical protein A3I46_00610 [Candidatus Kaiserbacteria bacterium RIFCSPLOWO2_02_FULL_54_13]|uniref:Uncharacterized protein n=1 Tax=Candidatus Kaiserbacteria bacterium RIFCSPHIGHO2_02_FULL_54_22 TaxID=1798495 RepID=A0A1F6DL87_9BACT|nr:MAG: hypothetical protein A3C19_01380 [Candidatus Kaiserbacteria bacterium RIFCSPHIGHO2_02_FULL_54_22]OGG68972.1 MAG: hypothetical protein A3E99_03605 [Candidatus Kaiserbacteria bacterium RIFCSPHIGHO2_12_FULL_54_16]OGG82493.1 MAG: hypothetical protein A3I46_00610 [Candidatus Kaiserbacteria bacterium RIFCSPLOWO2_02_FULL_54_13]OGG90382.1 MAG: hypothetical protein A3G12_00800 [Candidatus Kaiserbacteria bacterium RIFCSPLOWO2_12_FULL_54_10]
MEDAVFKPWCVNAVVSVLQFLLGIGMYWWFGSVAIAAATVGFVTFCSLLPIVEGAFPRYCEMMEQIVGAATSATFAIAISALAAHFLLQENSYLGWGFLVSVVVLLVVAFLLLAFAFVLVLIIAGDYKSIDKIQEPPLVFIVCLLPAGIGLLFGAFYFPIRHYRRRVSAV